MISRVINGEIYTLDNFNFTFRPKKPRGALREPKGNLQGGSSVSIESRTEQLKCASKHEKSIGKAGSEGARVAPPLEREPQASGP